jgi:hypothetical protein
LAEDDEETAGERGRRRVAAEILRREAEEIPVCEEELARGKRGGFGLRVRIAFDDGDASRDAARRTRGLQRRDEARRLERRVVEDRPLVALRGDERTRGRGQERGIPTEVEALRWRPGKKAALASLGKKLIGERGG